MFCVSIKSLGISRRPLFTGSNKTLDKGGRIVRDKDAEALKNYLFRPKMLTA